MVAGDYDDIVKLIEARISARVSEQIAEFAKNLSQRYRMNIHDVLACYPGYGDATGSPPAPGSVGKKRCQGVCGKGRGQRQCSVNARTGENYCGKHLWQGELQKQKAPAQIVHNGHTHPASVLFLDGCPGCAKRQTQRNKTQVIDLGLLG